MLNDVCAGLSRGQKELSSKYFYDQRGSELFEEITQLDEYYPTRTESKLLRSFGGPWIREKKVGALVELGAGNAEKTRILLDALAEGSTYIPVDISADFLNESAVQLRRDYPSLEVEPCVADITQALSMPDNLPMPAVFAFLGSTIGNFDAGSAVRLLRNVRSQMRPDDRFLMGADLVKDHAVLEAAYNDAKGITAAFNLNVLHVMNRELSANFDIDAFEHRAFYNGGEHRIEMHLVAKRAQTISIPGCPDIRIASGETIRTEISAKYDRARVQDLFNAAGLEMEEWRTDERSWYALTTARIATQ
jgi:L-histidine N-alpha-methyltransferase